MENAPHEKVTLPRKVADALEAARNSGIGDESIIEVCADPNNWWTTVDTSELNGVNLLTLACALINGYEIQQTPHERLRDCYEGYDAMGEYELGARNGIRNTLEILGVKVDGINR